MTTQNAIIPSGSSQDEALQYVVQTFNGHSVAAFYASKTGRVWVIAQQIGLALGYSDDGKQLVTMISRNWSDELEEGHETLLAKGKKLQQIKDVAKGDDESSVALQRVVTPFCSQLMLLSREGVNIVCMKTNKPFGKRLRRFLAYEVLPALNRKVIQLAIESQPLPPRAPEPTPAELNMKLKRSQALRKNRRLRLQERQQDEKERQAEHVRELALHKEERSMLEGLRDDPYIDQRGLRTAYCALLQKLTGDRVLSLLKPEGNWRSPSQMADAWDSTRTEIGHLIKKAGLKGHPEFSRPIVRKAMNGVDKLVDTYEYNEEAQDIIFELLQEKRAGEADEN